MVDLENGDEVERDDPGEVRNNVEDVVNLAHLSHPQRVKVLDMIKCHGRVFSAGESDIGRASVTEHQIILNDDTPIYQRPRRFPQPINDEIDRQCRELCDADIIEPSISPFSSPIVPVRKKDGTIRMCIDYRRLNSVTVPDKFPVPNLLDSIFSLHGNKFFTKLDLIRGYYQLPLSESSR